MRKRRPVVWMQIACMTQDSQAMLVTADQSLAREVLRLAAAAGVDPLLVATPSDALRLWSRFGVILVGVDLASACAQVAPPRRNDVHVLSNGAPGSEAFAQALAIGAQSLIDLAGSPSLLLETLSNVGEGTNPPAVVVGVIGGAGGAGASVLAAALARVSSWTQPTLLIDADPLGAGSDRLFGLEFAEGARWDSLVGVHGRLSGWSMRDSLLNDDGLSLMCFPQTGSVSLTPDAIRRVIDAGSRGFDMVVIDLPRHLDPACEEAIARCHEMVVVSTTTLAAVASVSRLIQRLPFSRSTPRLITRGNGLVAPHEVAQTLKIPLHTSMGNQRGLDEDIDLGAGPVRRHRGPLARTAQALANEFCRGA